MYVQYGILYLTRSKFAVESFSEYQYSVEENVV
jgi:hypothetical protein